MTNQQDIYTTGSKNRPPILNKDNYVPWSSCLLRYAKRKPNKKLLVNSILHGPYVRRMIVEPGDPDRKVPVAESFHEHTDEELTEKEVKQMEADDQAIQTILMGLPEDIYATVDSCETAQEIWLRIQQMMKEEVNELGAERLAKTHDPLVLMANSHNPYNYLVFHPDHHHKLPTCNIHHLPSNKNYVPQPSFNMNYILQPMPNPEDISDPRTAMNMALNAGNQVGHNTVQNPGIQNVWNQNGLIVISRIANHNANQNRNGNVVAARTEGNGNENNEAGIQLQDEEFDLMDVADDIYKIEKVNANCILMANLQQALTSGTQNDKALVYDLDGSTKVHHYKNCYDNEIFIMFTQEDQYTELLKPITEPHLVQQNTSNVIIAESSVEHNGGTVEHHATIEETHAYFESLYNNLVIKVEKVNTVNRKMKETNADLTTELARYKGQEKCFEFNQEKFDKLESSYKILVYQEQCLTKKINALHLNSFYHTEHRMALGYENPHYLKQTQKKQQSLYNGKVLLDKHDPPNVYDLEETLQLAQESLSKPILIPDDGFSDNASSPSVAQKFLNEVHKILKYEIAPIVNQVDVKVIKFEKQFLKEAAKFV
ncbi:hypothetical protein Tco_0420966 [Tanacetum coccineum]